MSLLKQRCYNPQFGAEIRLPSYVVALDLEAEDQYFELCLCLFTSGETSVKGSFTITWLIFGIVIK